MNVARASAAVLVLAGSVLAADAPEKRQNEYLFPYDLGPAEVDVSRYPPAMRGRYKVFAPVCSQCHTLARSVNAPFVSRKEWGRYVDRMHFLAGRPETEFTRAQAKEILEFLVYDSAVRKVRGKKEFEARAAKLRRMFEEVRRARGLKANERRDGAQKR